MEKFVRSCESLGVDCSGLLKADLWIGGAFAAIFFMVPLLITANSFIRQMRSAHYSELDRTYMDVLRMAMDHPFLRDRALIPQYVQYLRSQEEWLVARGLAGDPPKWEADIWERRTEEARRYDSYAFLVFNFLETIHDRCDENRDYLGRPEAKLRGTWEGIIGDEYNMHREWFEYETVPNTAYRSTKFCIEFAEFIWSERWRDAKWGYLRRHQIKARYQARFLDE
jgi:hypothetical protein